MDQTIPSSSTADHGGAARRLPRREDLSRAAVLKQGDGRKADVLALDTAHGPLVVKDFSRKGRLRRLMGRLQIRRELRVYRRLQGLDGVPRLIGRVDAHALALERIDGGLLAKADDRFSAAERHLAGLRRLVDGMHERGVVHLDLRGKSNVLLRDDGRLAVVDMATALCFRPGSLAHRVLFPWLAIADETGFLKWKARLAPDLLAPGEESLLRRFRGVRRLWIFNRRHARPAPAKPGGSGIASRLPPAGARDAAAGRGRSSGVSDHGPG